MEETTTDSPIKASGLFLYPYAKELQQDQEISTKHNASFKDVQTQPSNASSKKFSFARAVSSGSGTKKSKASVEQSDRRETKQNPWLTVKPSVSFGSVTSKRSDKSPMSSHAIVKKDDVAAEARSESEAEPETTDSRDQVEALREKADPPGTRSYGTSTPEPEVQIRDDTSFQVELVNGYHQQNLPEWDYVDSSKKETFQAQSGCYGCTADLIDRVLDDGGNDDIGTLATLESVVANENDRQPQVDERIHDALMLVGGCVNTFLPEPTEKTMDIGASILNLAVDISEAKFL